MLAGLLAVVGLLLAGVGVSFLIDFPAPGQPVPLPTIDLRQPEVIEGEVYEPEASLTQLAWEQKRLTLEAKALIDELYEFGERAARRQYDQ